MWLAFFAKTYPPLVPLILLTKLYFLSFKKICSKYCNEILCLKEMSLRLIGSPCLKLAISASAITAYLDLVFNRIFVSLFGLIYIPD